MILVVNGRKRKKDRSMNILHKLKIVILISDANGRI